jgi:hypothetical protein
MLEIVNAPAPVLVRVTGLVPLAMVTGWLPKLTDVGDRVTAGTEAQTPFPARVATCGLEGAVSATVTEAHCVPFAVGVKVTLMTQFPPPANWAGRVPQVWVSAKSPGLTPVIVTLLTVKAVVPMSRSVMFSGWLVVPTFWLSKLNVHGPSVA